MKVYTIHEIKNVDYTINDEFKRAVLVGLAMTLEEAKTLAKALLARKASEAIACGNDILQCETIPQEQLTVAERIDIYTYSWKITETETI